MWSYQHNRNSKPASKRAWLYVCIRSLFQGDFQTVLNFFGEGKIWNFETSMSWLFSNWFLSYSFSLSFLAYAKPPDLGNISNTSIWNTYLKYKIFCTSAKRTRAQFEFIIFLYASFEFSHELWVMSVMSVMSFLIYTTFTSMLAPNISIQLSVLLEIIEIKEHARSLCGGLYIFRGVFCNFFKSVLPKSESHWAFYLQQSFIFFSSFKTRPWNWTPLSIWSIITLPRSWGAKIFPKILVVREKFIL